MQLLTSAQLFCQRKRSFNTVAGMSLHATGSKVGKGNCGEEGRFQYRCRYEPACNVLRSAQDYFGSHGFNTVAGMSLHATPGRIPGGRRKLSRFNTVAGMSLHATLYVKPSVLVSCSGVSIPLPV